MTGKKTEKSNSKPRRYVCILKFSEEVRGTRPTVNSLAQQHIEAVRGRILDILRKERGISNEKQLEKKAKKWLESILSTLPRKQFNNVDQIAIPSRWIYGLMKEKIRILRKINSKIKINEETIRQYVKVRPKLIGLLRPDGKPVTSSDLLYTEEGIHAPRRDVIKVFETVKPPVKTEKIYITIYDDMLSREELEKLIGFGRLGAGRGLGYGEFKAIIREADEDE